MGIKTLLVYPIFALTLYLTISLSGVVTSLKLTEVKIPRYALLSSSVRLECNFLLDAGEGLYSLKWYKGYREFYRYHPKSVPAQYIFPGMPGVSVNGNNSGLTFLELETVTAETSGIYRCEVTADAPSFKVEIQEQEMEAVAILPASNTSINEAVSSSSSSNSIDASSNNGSRNEIQGSENCSFASVMILFLTNSFRNIVAEIVARIV